LIHEAVFFWVNLFSQDLCFIRSFYSSAPALISPNKSIFLFPSPAGEGGRRPDEAGEMKREAAL
jgi:hypothetical protein